MCDMYLSSFCDNEKISVCFSLGLPVTVFFRSFGSFSCSGVVQRHLCNERENESWKARWGV